MRGVVRGTLLPVELLLKPHVTEVEQQQIHTVHHVVSF